MNNDIHLAIQIVPLQIEAGQHPYAIIDKAIDVIDQSGLTYQVCAMETVIQGKYDRIMSVIKEAQQVCFDAGANELIVNIKLHIRKDGDVTWGEKMEKYSG
ncbi:MAG TPA: thiamine-binding protein [Cyclobacteriaceae bacterium]|nr:thiamine-binding protein [Cyclobacteriaceae bacterium]